MKKIASVLLLALFTMACALALEGLVTWTWFENDPDVEFFRYQVDGEDDDNWTVVDWSVNEVTYELDVSVIHTLYLQQSYDGVIWSESSMTDSEIFLPEEETEEPVEEEVPEQQPEQQPEQAAEEVVDISGLENGLESAEEKKEVYKPLRDIDLGFSYMNFIPDTKGPKSVGIFASYSHTFGKAGIFDFGVKANLSLYTTKALFTDPSSTQLHSYLNALAMLNAVVGNCDIYGAIGPDLGFRFVKENSVHFGIAAEVGVRYHRFKTVAFGLSLTDHQYLAPLSKRFNWMDLKLFVTKSF